MFIQDILKSKSDCCGCEACMNVCPLDVISMECDEYGFLYPHIDQKRCIHCGKCLKVCDFSNRIIHLRNPLAAYAVINKDMDMLKRSASGGAFGAIAKYVLENGGVVFGCAWNDNMEATHIAIRDVKELHRLQSSKYVQSRINFTYREVKKYLSEGILTLFSGTPCQVAGLLSFLGKEYENLITVDLICHGVPNAIMLKEYIQFLSNKLKGKILDVNFRDKTKSWSYVLNVKYNSNGLIKTTRIHNSESYYFLLFLNGSLMRESCYVCKYATPRRTGDFTVGDYWGYEKSHPHIKSRYGVSLLLSNTDKSNAILNKISDNISMYKTDYDVAQKYNAQLNEPTKMNHKRKTILERWRLDGTCGLMATIHVSMFHHLLNLIKINTPYQLKQFIKTILCAIYSND